MRRCRVPVPRGGAERVSVFLGDFCDWYIEWVKPDLQSAQRERAVAAWRNLFAALDAALRLLHPFMPFINGRAVAPVAATAGS